MLGSLQEQPPLSTGISSFCRTEALIAATSVSSGDRVVVIGRGALEHLLGLARFGCKCAGAFRSPSACRGDEESADVVWFTGVDAIDADIEAIIDHLDTPRAVAIELNQADIWGGTASIVGRLRAKGFIDHTVAIADGHPLVVAVRPVWLRRVI
ncbi:hypothetical protein [Magnetospirillum molischianum]|uniref:Uncharacterized protein n=1 Tax=Magnetospirillum molischianum DSM 120 TaxID=1150626 RepID=H8FQM0_MAGML|nr:hypothetical protein [Magnetospirillum molischianum]CCG40658.1 hypothetical protein PHAMO_210169 [Magnetospirillum molischianum DSM 120]